MGKLIQPARYGERFINIRTRSKITYHDLSSEIEIFFNFLKQFDLKYRSNQCRKLLEGFKQRKLKSFGSQAQNLQFNNIQKR